MARTLRQRQQARGGEGETMTFAQFFLAGLGFGAGLGACVIAAALLVAAMAEATKGKGNP